MTQLSPVFFIIASAICVSSTDRISLYERKRIEIDPETKRLQLHLGLNNRQLNTVHRLFRVDFNFDQLLVQNDFDCEPQIHCRVINSEEKEDEYNGNKYHYYSANTFISFYRISPSEISEQTADSLPGVPFRYFTKTLKAVPNVIGLAPNSQTWDHWNRMFYFKNQQLNVTLSLYPEWKFLRFYSSIPEETVMQPVSKLSSFYKFDSQLTIDGLTETASVCVDHSVVGYLGVSELIHSRILAALCHSPSKCSSKEDLKKGYEDVVVEFRFSELSNKAKQDVVQIRGQWLVWSGKNGLEFGFTKERPKRLVSCDAVFLSWVFEEYYFLVSNDLSNSDFLKAGFLKIYPRDFFVLNLWKYMAWLALILTSVYLLYRFAFKRAPTEEQSSDVYRQFGGSQTGPNTDRLISETTR